MPKTVYPQGATENPMEDKGHISAFLSKLYIPSTINTKDELLSTTIWAVKTGLVSGRHQVILKSNNLEYISKHFKSVCLNRALNSHSGLSPALSCIT